MYNLLSIALGLLGWGVGIAAIVKRGCPRCAFVSMSACCTALFFQLKEALVQVEESDWSAFLDTWDTVVFAAAVLLVSTVILNLTALLRGRKKERPETFLFAFTGTGSRLPEGGSGLRLLLHR